MKYQTNEIVIIETYDAMTGKIRTVGIIRFAYEEYDAYEVNVLPVTGESAARNVMWWTVGEDEIKQSLGLASAGKAHLLG